MARQLAKETRKYKGIEYLAMLQTPMGVAPVPSNKVVQLIPVDPCDERDRARMFRYWIGKSYASWRDPKCKIF